jgi:arginase
MRVCFVSVPYDMGKYNVGHGQGPGSLMSSGLGRLLSESGHNVDSKAIICGDAEHLTDTQTTFKLNALLSKAVSEAAQSGALPIVLAGNCVTSAGTLSGLHNDNISMLWLDAHADFNTPETTQSGYLDGMALSIACGRCWKSLSAADSRYLAVKEDHVTLVGTRDLDQEEARALAESRIRVVTTEQLRKNNLQIPKDVAPPAGDLYIHLDADVLDTSVGHANRFASPGGLQEKEINSLLSWAVSFYNVVALAITAFGPRHDINGIIREALKRIVLSSVNAMGVR